MKTRWLYQLVISCLWKYSENTVHPAANPNFLAPPSHPSDLGGAKKARARSANATHWYRVARAAGPEMAPSRHHGFSTKPWSKDWMIWEYLHF